MLVTFRTTHFVADVDLTPFLSPRRRVRLWTLCVYPPLQELHLHHPVSGRGGRPWPEPRVVAVLETGRCHFTGRQLVFEPRQSGMAGQETRQHSLVGQPVQTAQLRVHPAGERRRVHEAAHGGTTRAAEASITVYRQDHVGGCIGSCNRAIFWDIFGIFFGYFLFFGCWSYMALRS